MMAGTLHCLRAEHYRLVRSRSTWVGLALLAVLAGLRVGIAFVGDTVTYAEQLRRSHAGGREAPEFDPGNAWGPFVDGWRTGLIVGTLLLVVAAGASLAADRRAGVLRTAVTRSVSRGGVLMGRVLLGVPIILGLVVVTGAAAGLVAAWLSDFGPLVIREVTLLDTSELLTELRLAVLLALPPMFATWCFGLAVSSVSKTAVHAVAAALVVLIGFDLFKGLLGDARWFVFAAFNPSPQDASAMNEMSGIARGFIDVGYETAQFNMNLVLPWCWALGFLLLAGLVLGRRSL
jgi:hypothetical protein